jgi:elongation factor P
MVRASDLKAGMVLPLEKNLYKVFHMEYHMGGGKMGGLVHLKLKDLKSGLFIDRKFKPEERLEIADLDRKVMEYLYKDAEGYFMMDPESYDQVQLDKHHLEAVDPFLQPNMKLTVEFLGEDPIHVIFPEWVELQVTSTPPGLGSLQDEVTKPATLSNGLQVQVPQFIKAGDWVKVNVAAKKYMERVKK